MNNKILVVEDQSIVAMTIESTLIDNGFIPIGPVINGEDVVEAILKHNPDLILLDIVLKGEMDGIEVAKIVNEQFNIPIIFLTASSSKSVYDKAKELTPYGFINKPYNENDLIKRIDLSINNHNAKKEINIREFRNKALLENIPDTIIVINNKEEILECNHANCNLKKCHNKDIKYQLKEVIPLDLYIEINKNLKEYNFDKFNFDIKLYTPEKEAPKYIEVRGVKSKNNEFILIIRDITEFINMNKKIKKLNTEKELRKTKALLLGQDIERVRLSKDLHDGIGQMLSASKRKFEDLKTLYFENENEEIIKSKFIHSISLLDEAIDEVRKISQNLMPTVLEDFGLKTALESICKSTTTESMQVNFSFSGNDIRFDSNKELMIYRSAQEAINNAQKHSFASTLNVMLDLTNEKEFELIVADDGKGFDKIEIKDQKGNGFRNIKERAKILGAQLFIESEKNNGTIIRLILK